MPRDHLTILLSPLRTDTLQANSVAGNILGEAWLLGEAVSYASGTGFADIPINNHRET